MPFPWYKKEFREASIRRMKENNPMKRPEIARKVSRALKGRPLPEEQKRKLRKIMKESFKRWKETKPKAYRDWLSNLSLAQKRYFKAHPEKVRENIERMVSAFMDKYKNDPEFRTKHIKSVLKGLCKRPTSFEQKIINLIEKYSLPFKYVGNGEVLIAFRNPDFIATNGRKLLIETYFSLWHPDDYEKSRNKIFSKHGFKTLFLSEKDLCCDNWESHCLSEVGDFVAKSGAL